MSMSFTDRLHAVTRHEVDPSAALADVEHADLVDLLEARFPDPAFDGLELLGSGRSRRAGDVCGVLALSRDVAERARALGVPYVYAVEHGDARDFAALRHCAGFITGNPAPTAFAPVQAVSEDRPTLVGLTATAHDDLDDQEHSRTVHVEHDGVVHSLGDQPPRRLRFGHSGEDAAVVEEGEWLAVSGTRATVRRGHVACTLSPVARFHRVIEEILDDAVDRGHADDAAGALDDLDGCPAFAAREPELAELAADPVVRGFEEVKRLALSAPLSTWATAHTADGVARARMLTGSISPRPPYLHTGDASVGLLRDERIWSEPGERELLQLVFLGPEVLGPEVYARVRSRYLSEHGERIYRILRACRGGLAVVRTLCMPIVKIFPVDFDSAAFAERHGIDADRVRAAVTATAGEQEVYQGWRGMRVFSQRPDIAELWLRAVLGAARRVHEDGHRLQLRLLLATITLPGEAERFLDVLDEVAPDVLGDRLDDVLRGVSIMMETTGAYVAIEKFLAARGRHSRVDGAMVGSNDLTAALLNFHREDAARTIIPGYVDGGLLDHNPFETLEPTIVAPSVLSALRRCGWDPGTAPAQLWGLGGELAGDWDTVQWLATHAQPLGMSYVTTAPRNMLPAAFAAAQAVARAGG